MEAIAALFLETLALAVPLKQACFVDQNAASHCTPSPPTVIETPNGLPGFKYADGSTTTSGTFPNGASDNKAKRDKPKFLLMGGTPYPSKSFKEADGSITTTIPDDLYDEASPFEVPFNKVKRDVSAEVFPDDVPHLNDEQAKKDLEAMGFREKR